MKNKRDKLKILVFFVLLFAFVLSMFVGCTQQLTQTTKTQQSQKITDAKAANAVKYIAFVHKSNDYYAFVAMQIGMKKAVESRGWKFEAAVSDFDAAKQADQIQNFITKKPDAILTDPIDSEGLIDTLDKSVAAGIPVSIIDTPTTGGNVAVTVDFDNYLAGQMSAQEIVKRLKIKYGSEKGIVLNAYGQMSSWAWRLRKEGFDDIMDKYPNIKYLAMPAEGDKEKTKDALVNALSQYPNIDAVHAPSDNPALGLQEALEQQGKWRKVGEVGHVIFVTIDAEPIAIQNIEADYYDATVCQDCVCYGEVPIELLEEYTFKGEKVPTTGTYKNNKYYWKEAPFRESPSGPYLVIPPYVIDKANASDPKHWGNVAFNDWGMRYN